LEEVQLQLGLTG